MDTCECLWENISCAFKYFELCILFFMINCFILPVHNSRPVDVSFRGCVLRAKMTLFLSLRELSALGKNRVWRELLNQFVRQLCP